MKKIDTKKKKKTKKKFTKQQQLEIKQKQEAVHKIYRILTIVKIGLFLGVLYLVYVKLYS